MAKKSQQESTGTTSEVTEKETWISKISLGIWWPVIILLLLFGVAGATKYLWPNDTIYSLMIDLTKAISLLFVVFYVIYTRLLAVETKKMANASMSLFYSDKGTVRSKLQRGDCSYDNLCGQVKEITEKIHLEEKGFTESEFQEVIKQSSIPSIEIMISNFTGRPIQLTEINYNIRHTGSVIKHDITIMVDKDARIAAWKDKILHLCAAPEGEIEIDEVTILFIDNRNVLNKVVNEGSMKIDRLRKPKNTEDEQ